MPAIGQIKFREAPNQQVADFLNDEEATDLFLKFQKAQAIGSFRFDCKLEFRPFRARTVDYQVRILGNWLNDQRLTRIDLMTEQGERIERLLIITSSNSSETYRYKAGDTEFELLTSAEEFESLSESIPLSSFALSLPFLLWDQFEYRGPSRTLGRPTQNFLLTNPKAGTSFPYVTLTIDEDFFALLEANFLNKEQEAVREFRVRSIGKAGDRWIPKHWSITNEESKDSIHIKVNDASFNNIVTNDLLDPKALLD